MINKSISFCLFLFTAALWTPNAFAGTYVMALKVPMQATLNINSDSIPFETTYYTCDGLTSQVEDLLSKLGASDIKVECSGGYFEPVRSPSLTVNFNSILLPTHGLKGQVVTANWHPVALHQFDDCETHRQLLAGLAPSLELTGLNLKACSSSNDSFHYNVNALLEEK